ncbi:tetratricopeptide repeat protein [Bacteroidota bacterium]
MSDKINNQHKELSRIKIIYIIVGFLFIGMIILYSSDTFEPLPNSFTNYNTDIDQYHKGTDLLKHREIRELESIIDQNPNDQKSLLKLAHLLNDSGFYERAIVNYKKYLYNQPEEVDVIIDMGVCYFQLKKYDDALYTMKQALKIDSNHQIGHFNLGVVYKASGNESEANNWWTKTVEINPNSKIALRAKELLNSK